MGFLFFLKIMIRMMLMMMMMLVAWCIPQLLPQPVHHHLSPPTTPSPYHGVGVGCAGCECGQSSFGAAGGGDR